MSAFTFCPLCGAELTVNNSMQQVCPKCRYKNYDSPVPVVAGLVMYQKGIVLVQRKRAPFIGEWCMPCGFVNSREDPETAVIREVQEETGLIVRPVQILQACNPAALGYDANQLIIHYLTEVVGGRLQAGDDASSVGVFVRESMPNVCFRTHQTVIEDWVNSHMEC